MHEEKMKKTKYMKKGSGKKTVGGQSKTPMFIPRKGGGKTTKYMKKGGMLKRMGGGMAKKTKYMSKGGLLRKAAKKLTGMARRRNARRG